MKQPLEPTKYRIYQTKSTTDVDGYAIVEKPVSLTVNGEVWLSFMCTPVLLEEMAVGFLYNEGFITTREEVASVRLCARGDNVDVWLEHDAERPEMWRRTSGCTGGVTRVAEEDKNKTMGSPNGFTLSTRQVNALVAELFASQELYREAGGVHTSALSDGKRLIFVAEDIGRHNSLDKIAGHCLLNNTWPKPGVLITTGRISSEMLQKADRIGASVVISRTAPSSLAIEMAKTKGVTLIGYARRDRFQVYTHDQRILGLPESEAVYLASNAASRNS